MFNINISMVVNISDTCCTHYEYVFLTVLHSADMEDKVVWYLYFYKADTHRLNSFPEVIVEGLKEMNGNFLLHWMLGW